MNGNPFYVSPLGGLDIGQSVTNMGNQWKQNELMDMKRTHFEQGQEQQAQAKKMQEQIKALTPKAMQGDINALQEIYALDPSIGQKVREGAGIRDEAQAKQTSGWLQQYHAKASTDPKAAYDWLQQTAAKSPIDFDDKFLGMPQEEVHKQIMLATPAFFDKEQLAMLQGGASPQATAGQRERAELLEQSRSDDPIIARSARIALGLDPRATGSAQQTIAERGTAQEVAEVAKTISGGAEQGKLMAQLNLQPEIKSAVQKATLAVQAEADVAAEARSDNAAWKVYEMGLTNLSDSLGKTVTGPGIGLLPAITSDQQSADGAVALMAPLLKQIFRTSGEGTFTDQDQKMLMAMVPTRNDAPEARKSKLGAIDSVIRAKLKQGDSTSSSNQNDNDPLGLGL